MSAAGPVVYEFSVDPSWLDYNGHMNVAYYALAFDLAGEEFVKEFGMGLEYTERTQNSWMVVEAHIAYRAEARQGDRLRITSRVLDFDGKRAHLYQEMDRGDELLASQEQLMLHVSLATRRASPFEADILARLQRLHAAQQSLALPANSGRRIGLHQRR